MKTQRTRVAVRRALIAAAAALSSASALPQTQMPLYQVLDIGTLGGNESGGQDINDSAEVTGSATTAHDQRHAIIYRDGELIDLGTLKTDRYGNGSSSGASINNKGEVAGEAQDDAGHTHAVLYSNGAATDLGTLGGTFSSGVSINESGQVSGLAYPATGDYHAFRYTTGMGMEDLGTLGDSYSRGNFINDAGEVAGIYQRNFLSHAFLVSQGTMTDLVPGSQSFLGSGKPALNSAGHVAGTRRVGTLNRAFIYRDGVAIDLGLGGAGTSSDASAINDSDQVTGNQVVSPGVSHAFLWTNGTAQDLGTLGGNFSNGNAINASGQVTGQSSTAEGFSRPFVYVNGEIIYPGLPEGGLNGSGNAINSAGQVTGTYQVLSADHQSAFFRGFIATPISLLFSKLEDKATGAGPGALLRNTARLATHYYNQSDAKRTCATLTAFEIEAVLLSFDKRRREPMRELAAEAHSLKTTAECIREQPVTAARSANVSKSAVASLSPEEKQRALQWYRERIGIREDGMLIEGQGRDRLQ